MYNFKLNFNNTGIQLSPCPTNKRLRGCQCKIGGSDYLTLWQKHAMKITNCGVNVKFRALIVTTLYQI